MTFSVIVNDCVEVAVGSSIVQAVAKACVCLLSLVSSVNLTNLTFELAYEGGFLTTLMWRFSNLVFDLGNRNSA